jgi:REP element-mobilizing transposase RayT
MTSYRQIYYHIVFGTKFHRPVIPEAYCEKLYQYISGMVRNKNCHLYQINGGRDHLHILSDLHPSIPLAEFVKDIKVSSSMWMKETELFPHFEGWADGYAAFTVSHKDRERVITYIQGQKEHHKKVSFEEEYRKFLEENGIEYNEKFLF